MAEYLIEYTNDRQVKVDEQEALGRQMLHDDFTATGGIMTFIDPIPLTAEEIQLKVDVKATSLDSDQVVQLAISAFKNWATLTAAQKDRILKGLLADFIVRRK